MRKILFILVLLILSVLAIATLAQDDEHTETDCTAEMVMEHIMESDGAPDDLDTDADVHDLLDVAYEMGLLDLAADCGYSIDPHSIGDPENGELLFNTMIPEVGFACATCHRVDSDETLIGPGLLNVANPAHDHGVHNMDMSDDMDMDSDDDDHDGMDMDSDDDHDDGDSDDHDGMDMDSDDADDEHADDDMDMDSISVETVNYIYTSITDPSAFVMEGFPDNLMPQTFSEIFTEEEIYDLVAYLVSLHYGTDDEHSD